jgi:two-component system, sensor histidine kinase
MFATPAELARSALDAAPDAMLIIDESGVIRYANRQVSAVFGYSHDEVIGRRVDLLMPERFRERHHIHRKDFFRSPRMRPMGQGLELYGRRADGSEFPVEISLSPIDTGDGYLVAAAIRDATARKHAEAELIAARHVAERARETADQARCIADAARESADRANRAKSRFLATASHDLRQPLQTLGLLNGTLRRTVRDAEICEVLLEEEQAIGAMTRLLNALLDISKLESGAIKPQPADFAVADVFAELHREFANLAANKGITFEVEPADGSAHSDPSLIEQMLRNLVANAIKYTSHGRVRLSCSQAEDAGVRIEVLDTGIGIPADQLASIFEEFYQVGVPTNSSRDGYGLGLSIVQRIATLLDVKLDVQSELGRGSSFSVVLPSAEVTVAATPLSRAVPPIQQLKGQADSPRVLLVEDDASVRDATRMLLAVEGFQVTAVASLEEALRATRSGKPPDLLVTDYHLRNGETGTQVIAAVRDVLGAPVKSVLITGDTSSAIRELPRDPHLRIASKPINADQLIALMKDLLDLSPLR